MAVPSVITDLSATAASNSPAGSDAPSVLDDIQRAHGAFIRQLYDSYLAGVTFQVGTSTPPTTEGQAYWNSSTDKLTIGDGAAALEMVDKTSAQTLTNKTLTAPVMTSPAVKGVTQTPYTITDGAAFEINPANGDIQLITLTANRTPKATTFVSGQSVVLMVNDGTGYTITWTDTTFGSGGVIWVGGTAPTLATSGYTIIVLWKVGTQVYANPVGSVA